jgi:hypothetical protein
MMAPMMRPLTIHLPSPAPETHGQQAWISSQHALNALLISQQIHQQHMDLQLLLQPAWPHRELFFTLQTSQ